MDIFDEAMEVESLTVVRLLDAMGLSAHLDRMTALNIDVSQLLDLKASRLQEIFPPATSPIGISLAFCQKYARFMDANGLALDSSFVPYLGSDCSRAVQKDLPTVVTVDMIEAALPTPSVITMGSLFDSNIETSTQNPQQTGTAAKLNMEEESDNLDNNSDSEYQQSSSDKTSSSDDDELGDDDNNNREKAEPLVRPELVGKRRMQVKTADKCIDELNLRKLFKKDPLCNAVTTSYKKNGFLTEDDRGTLARTLAIRILRIVTNPTGDQYITLVKKILALFPKEKAKTWYIAPKTEGLKQVYAKGKLPDKIKNSKYKMRCKGALPPVKRKKQKLPPPSIAVVFEGDELQSKEWLMRNKEPVDEVRYHWRRCATPRIKELHDKPNYAPHEYIKDWNSILLLPSSYQLILDDFDALPSVDKRYLNLKDKGGNLLLKWKPFRESVIQFATGDNTTLNRKDKKDLVDKLAACPDTDENAKDYIILRILPALCKQRGRVKLGTTVFKPSVKESKDAFILHVPGAEEFEKAIRDKKDRHATLKAPLQPYVMVQEDSGLVRASYVIVDTKSWKLGSVLSAVEVCFKTSWVLNCGYSPEAQHLWQLIQNTLFDVHCEEDTNHASINPFLSMLK